MNDQDKRATVRVPVALRIRLRYRAVDQFISKFAINISRGGMFLSSRNPKPPGTELWFEIRLADDSPVIEGSAQVRWIREYNRNRPDEPHGMGIQFVELSEESWPVLDRIIEHRRAMGENDDLAIPDPRATTMGLPVAPAASVVDARSGPAADEDSAHSRATVDLSRPPAMSWQAAEPPSAAQVAGEDMSLQAAEPPSAAQAARDGDGARDDDRLRSELLRALTRPPAMARPEPPARLDAQPPAAAERESGTRDAEPAPPAARVQPLPAPVPSTPRAADPPMVRAAVARARTLAGRAADGGRTDARGESGDDPLDLQLSELLDKGAVPIEITVDAASRELAERLGGAPVERRPHSGPYASGNSGAHAAPSVRSTPVTPSPAAPSPVAPTTPAAPTRSMSLDEALTDDDLPGPPMNRPPEKDASADLAPLAMKAPAADGGQDTARRGLLHRLLRTKS
jgi:uncharacterized protein (TIGR02266 family)